MAHFVAYHNPNMMGYEYQVPDDGQQYVLTGKPVGSMAGSTVWVVTYTGNHDYSLAGVFTVVHCGDNTEAGFKHRVCGKGHAFRPWRRIGQLDWFPELMKKTGNFGLGLQKVTEPSVLLGLIELAAEDRYEVAT